MKPRIAPSVGRSAQRGLTLIELMISITIGLIILGALTYIYVGSRGAYRTNENLARVQESGRFALDFIAQDLRMTNYAGCRSRSLVADGENRNFFNVTQPPVPFNGSADGISGYEDGVNWTNPTASTATPIARLAGDVLTIRRAAGMTVRIVANTDPVARTVTIEHNGVGIRNGDVVVLANCERALMFRVTNNPVTTGIGNFPTVLEYKTSGAGADGSAGNSAVVPGFFFEPDSRAVVMRFTETSYFVGQNAAGQPALYRVVGNTAEELVDGVEDMEVLYGIDTTAPEPDGRAENYVPASSLLAAPATPNAGQVVSVRMSLLVRGPENSITTGAQTYAFRDTDGDGAPETQTAPDRRLRQVFTTTVALRNRIL
ncbi:prepilin-type N-terminal cleavage/methylation domain-containing protein [Betaproteobacteria bacterium PRO7]|jgi:type IV pilus assembly protein PilW|nr:prepilin-type N-terminal cleavage/methylation domain-containing protein [Betaproteobacteria bacterium PRO7]